MLRTAVRLGLLGCLLLISCTAYDPAQGARQIAATGVVENEIVLHSQAQFGVTTTDSRVATQQNGILALTKTEILVFADEGSRYSPRLRLPYSQIRQAALWSWGKGRQLQLFTDTSQIIISPITPTGLTGDVAASERAFAEIKSRGVAEITSPGFVSIPAPMFIFIPG